MSREYEYLNGGAPKIDFTALLDTAILSAAKEQDPKIEKLLLVFVTRGISTMDAMSMLMEICSIAQELNNEQEQK